MPKPELLSPAGDLECLRAALRFGADAVYLAGQRFGMRGAARNFSGAELHTAVTFAHAAGKKVYVACNIVPHPAHMKELPQWLAEIEAAGVDAVIVSDLGALRLAQKYAARCEVHVSTQAGVANAESAGMLYDLGAKRIILARELTLDEIIEIRQKTQRQLEMECFVHGSMCVSYSGRCLLSNYMTGRDANGGQCAQPCRWRYALMEETRPGEYFPVLEESNGTYIMHSKDMCLLPHLGELAAAGIDSFKIEGRAKAAYYTAVISNAYRTALDAISRGEAIPEWVLAEPYKVSHRAYCTGFYFHAPEREAQINLNGGYIRAWGIIGIVENWQAGVCTARQRNRAFAGDTIEALAPGRAPLRLELHDLKDDDGQSIDATRHPEMRFTFACAQALEAGTLLRREATSQRCHNGSCGNEQAANDAFDVDLLAQNNKSQNHRNEYAAFVDGHHF